MPDPIPAAEAFSRVLEHVHPAASRPLPLADAVGCVLAEEIRADRDGPPFDRAMMDGFAVRLSDAGATVPVSGEVTAGAAPDGPLADGLAVRIMTGAPCPEGTEAVVPVEQTSESGERVSLPALVQAEQHIARRGSDRKSGDLLLPPGAPVTPLMVAVLASAGRTTVEVIPRPTVTVISTGNELAGPGADPGPYGIRDSNRPMMEALVRQSGLTLLESLHAGDTAEELESAFGRAFAADIVMVSGGVSAGKYDLVPETAERMGAVKVFHKVWQRPGKPLFFATTGRRPRGLLFGLPGNPLAVHFCFHHYVLPAACRLAGKPLPGREGRAVLSEPCRPRGNRPSYLPARVEPDPAGGRLRARLLPVSGSADIYGAAAANALVHLDPQQGPLARGDEVTFFWLGPAEEVNG
jgi:molybdopterin molybdotransferase